jgi:hypothetical protein
MVAAGLVAVARACGSKKDDAKSRLDEFKALIEKIHTTALAAIQDGQPVLQMGRRSRHDRTVGEVVLRVRKVEVA